MTGRSLCWAFNDSEGQGLRLIADLSISRPTFATLPQISPSSLFSARTVSSTTIHWENLLSSIETCKVLVRLLPNVSLPQIVELGAFYPNFFLSDLQNSNLSHHWFDLSVFANFTQHMMLAHIGTFPIKQWQFLQTSVSSDKHASFRTCLAAYYKLSDKFCRFLLTVGVSDVLKLFRKWELVLVNWGTSCSAHLRPMSVHPNKQKMSLLAKTYRLSYFIK